MGENVHPVVIPAHLQLHRELPDHLYEHIPVAVQIGALPVRLEHQHVKAGLPLAPDERAAADERLDQPFLLQAPHRRRDRDQAQAVFRHQLPDGRKRLLIPHAHHPLVQLPVQPVALIFTFHQTAPFECICDRYIRFK